MPVPLPLELRMNSTKSAELIKELKAETEKLVDANSLVVRPEADVLGMVSLDGGFAYDSNINHLTSFRRNVIPYPDHNYGQQPPLTPPEPQSPDPNEQTDTGNEDEDEEGVTRCICGFDHDDGYMICCDRCGSWQHIDCMGIKSDSVPETYHCDRCEPRQLDVERARAIQQKKKDHLTDDDGDDDTDTEEEPGQTYTAVSNTPTRITLTATTVMKKKGKNRLKSINSEGKTEKRKKVNRKRQRTSTGQMSASSLHIDSNSVESYTGFENFQDIEENIYDQAVKCLALQDSENSLETDLTNCKRLFMLADVQENRKGLVAVDNIEEGQYITEYKGKVLLKATYEESNPFFKRSCPFLLHYNKIDQLELVVDARTVGNEARYVRRSCSPNSDVTHIVKEGNLHLMIHSIQPVSIGAELTIPFDYPLETYIGYIECACKEAACPVSKHNQRFLPQSSRKKPRYSVPDATSSTRNSASENQGETDSDENELDVGRPVSRRKKLSREERKLQAYLKQIEKMEKKEKKVKDPKAPQRPMLITDHTASQNSLLLKSSQSCENSPMHSQTVSFPRRISSSTPASGKKRVNFNKKRPRISSCSSDPLSPDVVTCSITSANSTPVQEQIPHILDQNEYIKQKTKKERIQENLSLSVALDKTLSNSKDIARKHRRDYLETVAGSPTPPSTPGQMSPTAGHNQTSLSVDMSNCLASPIGTYLTMQEKRSVLNGLLQIADQNDTHSTCSGSPQHSIVTSNGMATSEEVMGEIMTRESAPQTPSGKAPVRRLSNACKYFGSLKKRWLVQYNKHTPMDFRPKNGLSTIAFSTFINESSIQKRAEHIASYVFKRPKSLIPLKKRRLRERIMYDQGDMCKNESIAEAPVNEAEANHITKEGNIIAAPNDKESIPTTVRNEFEIIKQSSEALHASGGLANHTHSMIHNIDAETTNNVSYQENGDLALDKAIETGRNDVKSELMSNETSLGKLEDSSEFIDTISHTSQAGFLAGQEELKTSNVDITQSLPQKQEGLQNFVEFKFVEASGKRSPATENKESKDLENSINKSSFALSSLSERNELVYSNADISHIDRKLTKSELSSNVHEKIEADRTSVAVSDIDVSVVSPHDVSNSFVNDYCSSVTDSVIRPSSILRDPRLSSSSSRSSRDSSDGHVLVRSDSVSSIEEAASHRSALDKKLANERTDGMRNIKKKMSLREYRNRKKTKPLLATTTTILSTPNETIPVKAKIPSQSVFFTDTDSLLTPRTLSLSTGFGSLSSKDITSTTPAAGSVSMMSLGSSQSSNQAPSNGPLFEPVSPSEDFSLENTVNEDGTSFAESSFGNFPNSVISASSRAMEIEDEGSPLSSKVAVGNNDHEILPQNDPRKHYNHDATQQQSGQVSNVLFQVQDTRPTLLQRSKNMGSVHSPIYRQNPTYSQPFHG